MHPQWDNFFLAETGAAAALTGLLFVAVSINITEILRFAWLPGRAGETLTLLVGALIAASLVLLPEQSTTALGIEVVVIGLAVWTMVTIIEVRARRYPEYREHGAYYPRVALLQVATLPAVVAGIILLTGSLDGLYVLAAGIMISFVVAVLNAWILLVEIRR